MDIVKSAFLNRLINLEVNRAFTCWDDDFTTICSIKRIPSDTLLFSLHDRCLPFRGAFVRVLTLSEAVDFLVSISR